MLIVHRQNQQWLNISIFAITALDHNFCYLPKRKWNIFGNGLR